METSWWWAPPTEITGSNDRQGAAYVFIRDGAGWTQQTKLTARDGATGYAFGDDVAINGDRIVVGATYADIGGDNAGAAYVFVHNSTRWVQQTKLTAHDAGVDNFGNAAALDGDTILIGASDTNVEGNENQGAAYIYEREEPVKNVYLPVLVKP